MIIPKPLLSENVKDFMDYAIEVIKSMDGAPEHSIDERNLVNENINKLKSHLDAIALSYNETIPKINESPTIEAPSNFSGTGHS